MKTHSEYKRKRVNNERIINGIIYELVFSSRNLRYNTVLSLDKTNNKLKKCEDLGR